MATLHLIPHTHWDREWYLPFQSFRLKLVHLMDLLLDILARDPTFTFFTLDGQTVILEDYLEIRPEKEPEIVGLVRQGRLLIGPWYVLPDEFLVSPEGIIRNLLRGTAISARFGRRMDVGYVPDPFGHIGQLPQILRGFGIEDAAFRRGLADEPCELWWEAPDGSRVLTSYLRDGYDNAARLPVTPEAFERAIADRRASLEPHCATGHLLILNGTDHQEPQPEVASLARDLDLPDGVLEISTLPRYFEAIRKEIESRGLALPVVRGEARNPKRHHLLPAVLSSRAWIKQRSHECETLLEKWAEPFAAWAEILAKGNPERSVFTGHLTTPRLRAPQALLGEAWRLLFQCQPHDSICGCSVDQVHDEMRARFDQSEQIAEEITRQSLAALAHEMDTASVAAPGARAALVVFNPHDAPLSGIARCRLELPAGLDAYEIRSADGTIIPFVERSRTARPLADMDLDVEGLRGMQDLVRGGQALGLSVQEVALVPHGDRLLIDVALAEGADPNALAVEDGFRELEEIVESRNFARFRLLAHLATEVEIEARVPDVPPNGYRVLSLAPAEAPPAPAVDDNAREIASETWLARVEGDGSVTLADRAGGAIYKGLLRLVDVGDRGDSYTFCPVKGDQPIRAKLAGAPRRSINACGQSLTVPYTLEIPARLAPDRSARSTETVVVPISAKLTLRPGAPRLDIDLVVDNLAEDHRLQAVFPLGRPVDEGIFDGAYEIARRPARLPLGDEDWAEQPVAEVPMRCFAGAQAEGRGLFVAARGMREASVSPQGEIAVTLLRCFGWLSRDDLATRRGAAGPALPTPGGQEQGRRSFALSVIPLRGGLLEAAAEGRAFQSEMRAAGTRIHAGRLPPRASFLVTDGPGFTLTAVKLAEDGGDVIVRGVNLTASRADVELTSLLPVREARRARLDETAGEPIEVIGGSKIRTAARPHEVITIRLTV
jgi:alpha-mannosidase